MFELNVLWTVIIIVVGYLIGSVNFSIIISNHMYKKDVRSVGSGNAGATNMLRNFGAVNGVLTALGDMIKALVTYEITVHLIAQPHKLLAGIIAGTACLIGHCYPCYFKFKGGKGVSTAAMMLLILGGNQFSEILGNTLLGGTINFIILAIIFFGTATVTRYVSLASILTAVLFFVMSVAFDFDYKIMIWSACVAIFILYKHRANIGRLADGTENKLGKKKTD